jgi:hypothetical protein
MTNTYVPEHDTRYRNKINLHMPYGQVIKTGLNFMDLLGLSQVSTPSYGPSYLRSHAIKRSIGMNPPNLEKPVSNDNDYCTNNYSFYCSLKLLLYFVKVTSEVIKVIIWHVKPIHIDYKPEEYSRSEYPYVPWAVSHQSNQHMM